MTLPELNSKFIYKEDKANYGFIEVWTEPKEINNKFTGDCEDYAILAKRNIPEFKNWDYYYCRLNGAGHCVLFKNGNVIDCNTQKIVSFEQYCKIYKVTEFKKYNWFTIFSKLLFSKAYVWIHSLKN